MSDDRECIICKLAVPEDQTKLVHCGRCNNLISPGHHIHDACWQNYTENPMIRSNETEIVGPPMEPTASAGPSPGPQTLGEAHQFHEGFVAGLTAYAREKGDSTLKSKNELLRRLMDEQGAKTIEAFETLLYGAEGP